MKRKKRKQKKLEEFTQYCMDYADYIFVFERINGKRQRFALSELSEEKQVKWITGWWKAKRVPIRLKTPEELEKERKEKEGKEPTEDIPLHDKIREIPKCKMCGREIGLKEKLIVEFLRDWRWGRALRNHTFKLKRFICNCPHHNIYWEWFEEKWEKERKEKEFSRW